MSNPKIEDIDELSEEELKDELWRRGNIEYKLTDVQVKIKDSIDNQEAVGGIKVIVSSRQLGKTYLLCCIALETCRKIDNAVVKYVCPKLKDAKTIVKQTMRQIIDDCPDDIKPEWFEADKVWRFSNGSEIQLGGSDGGNIEGIRGGRAHLCIVDEAGFCDDLAYAVRSVLAPTTTTTGGDIILASTPSKNLDHPFITEYMDPFAAMGKLPVFTIDDNPNLPAGELDRIIARYPTGRNDPEFKREYMCQTPNVTENSVIPEFTPVVQDEVIREQDLPPFYDAYVGVDVGFVDLTVALFGYWDFMSASLVVLDELVIEGMNTNQLADGLKEKEEALFRNPIDQSPIKPYMRVMDNNLIVINDLSRLYGLNFIATQKHDRESAINSVRVAMANKKIIIHPRCETLIYHLKMAQWNARGNDFKRIKDTPDGKVKGGHCDALPALIYLWRNIVKSKNPFPDDFFDRYGPETYQTRHTPVESSDNFTKALKDIFSYGRKKKP